MTAKLYFTQRQGKTKSKFDQDAVKQLVSSIFNEFESKGYFRECFGFECVDRGFVPGKAGKDVAAYVIRKTKRTDLWPLEYNIVLWKIDDLFDFIEFSFDSISKPVQDTAHYHSYSDCGWHYEDFDRIEGQQEYRKEINEVLVDYEGGYELTPKGEIISLPEIGFENLIKKATLPTITPNTIEEKIEYAKNKFFRFKSTLQERHEAVRVLVDCLEFLRPKVKEVLVEKDESDLFNIANNFSIRHYNNDQKDNYDKDIWLSWMFYFYLATLHAALRLIERKGIKI